MKFGAEQQIWNSMAVPWPNIKIFKIQDGGLPPYYKNVGNAMTRSPMDRFG